MGLSEKKPPPKINLADFVKQDLKKIISSIEYFDEEKFEGGKKIKKKKEVPVESTEEPKVEEEAAVETSVKAKKRSKTGTSGNTGKKVKTASGTFKVSKK